jgi:NAD(P)-dependent dehydrogenase (short-subunit alcohol dehydrogenase family)
MKLFRANPEAGSAWVIGASKGLGAALACELAAEGYRVIASARSTDLLEELAAKAPRPGAIVPLAFDVTDSAASAAATQRVAAMGPLALAVLNAGTFLPMRAFRFDPGAFEQTFNLNFFGAINCLGPVIGIMNHAGFGHIALVSSSAGYGGLPKSAAYGASKAALINMAASLKFDLDGMNIRIQVVTPGFVDTPLTRKNDFPMPFLMSAPDAARAMSRGLRSDAFDITFPRRFTYLMKAVNLLPYRLYFPLIRMLTGAGRKWN